MYEKEEEGVKERLWKGRGKDMVKDVSLSLLFEPFCHLACKAVVGLENQRSFLTRDKVFFRKTLHCKHTRKEEPSEANSHFSTINQSQQEINFYK